MLKMIALVGVGTAIAFTPLPTSVVRGLLPQPAQRP